jgi:uncharacterized protein (DUF2267 family)
MLMPSEYQRVSLEFEKFLLDAREASGLMTTNQVYTMVQGVLQTFRRRLTLPEAIQFAGVLPVVLRALFVADWHPTYEGCYAETFCLRIVKRQQTSSDVPCEQRKRYG